MNPAPRPQGLEFSVTIVRTSASSAGPVPALQAYPIYCDLRAARAHFHSAILREPEAIEGIWMELVARDSVSGRIDRTYRCLEVERQDGVLTYILSRGEGRDGEPWLAGPALAWTTHPHPEVPSHG